MRISRKKRPQKPLIPHYRMNERIDEPEVRVLGENNENLGVLSIKDALAAARERELDLVEINPKAQPVVCKIVDFTHFKYQKEKEAKKQKARSSVSEVKGIRLSIRIGEHDMNIRLEQAKKFLERGDKVKTEIILRGRENAMASYGFDVTKTFFEKLSAFFPIQFEQMPAKQANKITSLISRK